MSEWQRFPKVELHLHLEGAAPPEFIRELAGEQRVRLDGVFDAAGAYKWDDFAQFLKVYEAACQVLRGPEEFYRLVQAVLAAQAEHGVVYTEHFISPFHCGNGDPVAWAEHLSALEEGAEAAEAALGITCRFISTAIRHHGPDTARATADLTAKTATGRLTGFGMGGEERHLMPADFAMAFAAAAEAGLGITSHAGEICGADQVAATLDALPVTRIGHGVRAIEDMAVVERLAREEIVLEVNPGSNISLSVFPDWAAHPITRLRDAGVKVTVSTDDPPYFHTDMTAEYDGLARHHGWEEEHFQAANDTAIAAAFCDEATRDAVRAKLTA